MQGILDEYLLEGGRENFWILSTIENEYRRGTHSAYINLSHQSAYYAEQTTFMELLSKPAYQNQIKQAFTLTFNDWKSLTQTAKSDLSHVLASSISRGINPRETAQIISKRLDVSMTKARALAQTEQLGAMRQAQWNETKWSSERLGLRTALLHMSAKLATSRATHVYWDGRIRTVEEVENWYEENGNRYNCHCAQIPILLNENGEPYNKFVIEQLTKEREVWLNE
nr:MULTISPECIES: phage minor head protein [unclassified Gilliamella]